MSQIEDKLQNALRVSVDLLEELSQALEWGKQEEKELKKLSKIVALLTKLTKINLPEKPPETLPEKDKEIIERFIKRYNERVAENN